MYDYEAFDNARRYHWRDMQLKIAKRLGYSYISEAIVDLYKRKKSSSEVGKIMSMSPSGVRSILHDIGHPILPKGGANNKESRALSSILEIDEAKRRNMTTTQQADAIGMSRSHVGRVIRRHGLPFKLREYKVDALFEIPAEKLATMSSLQIMFACDFSSIAYTRQVLKKHGVKYKKGSRWDGYSGG